VLEAFWRSHRWIEGSAPPLSILRNASAGCRRTGRREGACIQSSFEPVYCQTVHPGLVSPALHLLFLYVGSIVNVRALRWLARIVSGVGCKTNGRGRVDGTDESVRLSELKGLRTDGT
jgi:hypothetical protein